VSATAVVSLVPSLTDTVAALGCAERLVAVTRYCERGAPAAAVRIGGTKNPDVPAILALGCDLVLANTEENRPEDLAALRAGGLAVLETFPRSVADVVPMLAEVAQALDAPLSAAARLAADLRAALGEAHAARPERALRTLTLVWRRPWMGLGTGTYAADLLAHCGFATAVDRGEDRYPRLAAGDPEWTDLDVVLLPSEPYAFSGSDVPAVRDQVGEAAVMQVDGRLLTWHGPRTADALRTFTSLARQLSSCAPDPGSPRSLPRR